MKSLFWLLIFTFLLFTIYLPLTMVLTLTVILSLRDKTVSYSRQLYKALLKFEDSKLGKIIMSPLEAIADRITIY